MGIRKQMSMLLGNKISGRSNNDKKLNKTIPTLSFNEIEKLGSLWWESRTLLAAVEIGLFTILEGSECMTFHDIKENLGLHHDLRPDFIDALVSLNMLERKGNGPDALYSNTKETSAYLVQSSATYIGDVLENAGRTLYRSWENYTNHLKEENVKCVDVQSYVDKCYAKASVKLEQAQQTNESQISPDQIILLGFGFAPSMQLLSAVTLDLFSILEHSKSGTMSATDLVKNVGLVRHRADILLNMLVKYNILEETTKRGIKFYSNTPEASHFLDRNKETFAGGFLLMSARRCYHSWSELPEALCTGMRQTETVRKQVFLDLYEDPAKLEMFMAGMIGLTSQSRLEFLNKFDLSKYKSLDDIGGATGVLAIGAAKKQPKLKCYTTDLPPVASIAKRYIKEAEMQKQVKFVASDFFKNDFPSAEVIVLSVVLHDWPLKIKKSLIKKAYDALPTRGVLVVIDSMIDDDRRENTFGLLMSVHMLMEFGVDGGFDYTVEDLRSWCKEAGFSRLEFHKFESPQSMAVVFK